MLFYLSLEISGNSNWNFSCNGKHLEVHKADFRLNYEPLFGKGARAPPPNSRLDSWTWHY